MTKVFFLQQPATVTGISALICVIGYITTNKKRLQNFACIKLEEGRHVPQCPVPGDVTGHKQTHRHALVAMFRRRLAIRYDTRCYFNVRSKADISQLNLPLRIPVTEVTLN